MLLERIVRFEIAVLLLEAVELRHERMDALLDLPAALVWSREVVLYFADISVVWNAVGRQEMVER